MKRNPRWMDVSNAVIGVFEGESEGGASRNVGVPFVSVAGRWPRSELVRGLSAEL